MTMVAVNLAGDQLGGGWGRAQQVAVVSVDQGRISSWSEYDVRWDIAHDQGEHGQHHARIVTFLRQHDIDVVVTGHMGPPMFQMLTKLGITAITGVTGEARSLVEALFSEADDPDPAVA